jgi:hypothetical protein
MSVLVEKIAEPRIRTRTKPGFHLLMTYTILIILMVSFIGCRLTSIRVNVGVYIIAFFTLLAMLMPLPIYLHKKGRAGLRECSLILIWEVLFAITLQFPVLFAARSHMPLRDSLFGHVDEAFGVSVPGMMTWASQHWLGSTVNRSYALLLPLLIMAAFLPLAVGKVKCARVFLLANVVAFAIGLPLFALLPAAGPWHYYHFVPNPSQAACSAQLLSLRLTVPYVYQDQDAGVICFPSFHVVWAILCVAGLWEFRFIRIPIAVLSGMIVISTMTTGWHYFTDVLGGIAVAAFSIAISMVYAEET